MSTSIVIEKSVDFNYEWTTAEQGDVQKLRYEARIQRKRQAEARMRSSVEFRSVEVEVEKPFVG